MGGTYLFQGVNRWVAPICSLKESIDGWHLFVLG
jgi:hypothetical protein